MVTRFTGMTAVVLAGVSASFVFAVPPAAAQETPIVVQTPAPLNMNIVRVPYGDLNLATRAGERSLQRRVSRAVERVCLYDPVRYYALAEPDYNYCTWGAMARARPQMTGAIYRARLATYGRRY